MYCHDQEVCPLAGMSPEISVRDVAFSDSFPVLEADHCMWDFFESKHRLPNWQNPRMLTLSTSTPNLPFSIEKDTRDSI